jgi:hypothetical protein
MFGERITWGKRGNRIYAKDAESTEATDKKGTRSETQGAQRLERNEVCEVA